MSTCLKTGLDVFLIEYNATVRADVHGANGSIVINYEPKSWARVDPAEGTEPYARVLVGRGYMNQTKGIIVNPDSYSVEVK